MGKKALELEINSADWVLREWEEVLTIINGKNQKAVENPNGKYPIYGSGGIMSYSDDFLCPENTTIVGRKGTINKPILVKEKFWNVDTAFGIVAGNELDSFYLNYFCQLFDFSSLNKSTTLPSLAKRDLNKIKIPLPPLPEQKRIVAKLDGLFEKIDAAIALLEENIAHAQALMGSVLDEEFGKLESKYVSKPLAEIVTVINGRAYKKTEMLNKGKYPILRVGNFFSNRGWYYSDMELNDDKYCDKGDLLYAWSASFGPKIWDGKKSIYHYHIWKLVPLNSEISRKYIYYLLERDTEKIKEEGGRGVGMIHITKGGIEKRMMVLPPFEIQMRTVKLIDDFKTLNDSLLESQSQKLEDLKQLKSSLLDQAFKGEL